MTVKTDQIQAGISNTATNNFTVTTDQAGGMKLARGNAGATTQDVLTVDAAGYLKPGVLPNYANDTAAASGGVPIGGLYRNGSVVQVRVS